MVALGVMAGTFMSYDEATVVPTKISDPRVFGYNDDRPEKARRNCKPSTNLNTKFRAKIS